jgi:lactate dehydrogenase-like 2-hydroxyacid dehydrogenase
MKIYVTRTLPQRALDRLKEFCPNTVVSKTKPSLPQMIRGARDADGVVCLLTDPIVAKFVDACPRLKAISTVAVGTDNIDFEACKRRGIQVFHTPNVLTETTADLVWALMLAAARRIPEGDRMMRGGKFKGWALDMLLGVDVYGKTLGIVGPGRIGTAVARRAAGFAMRILTCGRNAPLEPVLRESDFVVMTTPLTPQTRHMIGRDQLAMMKPTAVLVNVGRGPVVEERALVEALRKRKIFAAGLDVYEFEPNVSPELRKLDNVVLLPHIGSASIETRERMALSSVNQLIGALEKL